MLLPRNYRISTKPSTTFIEKKQHKIVNIENFIDTAQWYQMAVYYRIIFSLK